MEDNKIILNGVAVDIEILARNAFEQVVNAINNGVDARDAVTNALSIFNGAYLVVMQTALSKLMAEAIGIKRLQQYKIGKLTLSSALYDNARQVASVVKQIIEDHARYAHNVHKLALQLFEGYNYRANEPLKVTVKLPLYLQNALVDKEVQAVLSRIQALNLVTQPLKASYLSLLDKLLKDSKQSIIEKAIKVAVYEKTRYFANRIAQTELHRAHTNKIALNLMELKDLEVVQYMLSATHPRFDICDLYANQDKYGLGRGIYPRALVVKPPLHPHCRCLLRPRLDLSADGARLRGASAKKYLTSLDAHDAALVAGSKEKLARMLNGESAESVYNENIPDGYKIQTIQEYLETRGF
jgi:hypothetical protein